MGVLFGQVGPWICKSWCMHGVRMHIRRHTWTRPGVKSVGKARIGCKLSADRGGRLVMCCDLQVSCFGGRSAVSAAESASTVMCIMAARRCPFVNVHVELRAEGGVALRRQRIYEITYGNHFAGAVLGAHARLLYSIRRGQRCPSCRARP